MKDFIKKRLVESLNEFSNGVYDNAESPIERFRTNLNYILGTIEMYQSGDADFDDLVDAVNSVNVGETVEHIQNLGNHYNKSLFDMLNIISKVQKGKMSPEILKDVNIDDIYQYIDSIQPQKDSSYKEL
jgi:hypothetical protein